MFEKAHTLGVNKIKSLSVNAMLILLLTVTCFFSLFLGRYWIDPYTVLMILAAKGVDIVIWALCLPDQFFSPLERAFPPVSGAIAPLFESMASLLRPVEHTWPPTMDTVIWQIRFPRTIAVVLVGSGLAVSGAAFQGTFRNPLVSENILGVSAGASVGAAIGILLNSGSLVIELCAFAFGVSAVTMTYLISRVYRSNPTLVLVLGGIVVGSLFQAMTSIIKYMADTYTQLPDIVYWLMGSFAKASWRDVYIAAPVILLPMLGIVLVRWRLNALSMGDEEARALGLDTKTMRRIVILCATLITAASVAICGIIGWVGLIMPHIGRMLVGPDHKALIPASILVGAVFLVAVDIICRTLTTMELPLTVITSVVGAPIFMYLLKKSKDTWT